MIEAARSLLLLLPKGRRHLIKAIGVEFLTLSRIASAFLTLAEATSLSLIEATFLSLVEATILSLIKAATLVETTSSPLVEAARRPLVEAAALPAPEALAVLAPSPTGGLRGALVEPAPLASRLVRGLDRGEL